MTNLNSTLTALILAAALCFAIPLEAQNPPMNCTPDGIVEVCTLTDTTNAASGQTTLPVTVSPSATVAYSKGQLSIHAENVPLAEVLHEIGAKTGEN